MKWDFDELRIVDSPGVNALGGVQNVSFQFFEDANAILFVHAIKPVESEPFKKFVNSVISNRSKETLFLVLTHAGFYSDSEITKFHSEAIRLYQNEIPEERILVVDSLAKLIHCDLINGKTPKEIRTSDEKRKLLAILKDKAEDEERKLKDVAFEISRFEKMFESIDKFSMQAPNIQLQEILESTKEGYIQQDNQYKENIEILDKKKRNPQEFEAEINRIDAALKNYKLLMNTTKEDLTSNYTGKNSEWRIDIDQLKAKYPESITKSDTFELARKHLTDGFDEIKDEFNAFSSALTNELSIRLEEEGKTFQEKHKITVPKVDLKSIEEKSKNEAYKTEDVGEWKEHSLWKFWKWADRDYFEKTGEKEVYDKIQHLNSFKTQCNDIFYKFVNDLPKKSKEVLNKYLASFNKQINEVIDRRQEALQNEKNKKQSNDEIIDEIDKMEIKKKEIQPELILVEEILEDLKC